MAPKVTSAKGERGTVLVLAALSMVALLGAGAIAVDAGHLYFARTELQTVADAAALAGAADLSVESQAVSTAVQYADANSAGIGETVTTSDVILGRWDESSASFIPGGAPSNAMQVTAQRTVERGNPVDYLFAKMLGREHGEVSATTVAMLEGGNYGTRFLLDEDMIDSDIPVIEDLAYSYGMDKEDIISDNDGDWFIDLPPGSILELPTGQVGDEGLFRILPDKYPFKNTTSPSHQDFLNYNEDSSSWRYDLVDKNDLDPLKGVKPAKNSDYASYVSDYVHVSPVFKSDVSYLGSAQVNALGERRGLLAFTILEVGDDPDGGGSVLPYLKIRVEDPATININTTGYWNNELGGGGARLVG